MFEKTKAGELVESEAVRTLMERSRLISRLRELLEHSSSRILHPVLAPTIQTVLEQLSASGEVLVSGVSELSYELIPLTEDIFKDLLDDATRASVKWPILIFRIPEQPVEWTLYHVLLFHEVGHALFKQNIADQEFALPASLELQQELLRAGNDLFEKMRVAQKQAFFVKTARRWAEELFADAVGALLVGPGFLAAASRVFALGGSLQVGSESHPPASLRLWLMSRALEQANLFTELPPEFTAVVKAWVDEASRLVVNESFVPPKSQGPMSLLSVDMLRQLGRDLETQYESILGRARQLVGAHACVSSLIKEDRARAELLHQLRIPPIEKGLPRLGGERGAPLDCERIFSICWCAYYLRQAVNSTDLPVLAAFGDVLLESLDAVQAMREWSLAS